MRPGGDVAGPSVQTIFVRRFMHLPGARDGPRPGLARATAARAGVNLAHAPPEARLTPPSGSGIPSGMNAGAADARRVAVVFVHGMGEQRRYADTARLASRLASRAGADNPTVSVAWDEGAGPADRRPRAHATFDARIGGVPARFYDVYWAPLVSGRTSFRSLWRWLRGRYVRPIGYLAAPWASHAQLKVTVLQEGRSAFSPLDLVLLDDYLAFTETARAPDRDRGAGGFGAFLSFLETRHAGGGDGVEAPSLLVAAAHAWRRRFRAEMLLTLMRALPLLSALAAAILSVPLTAAWLLARAAQPPEGAELLLALVVLGLWSLAFPLARLLVGTLGDVEVYATYTEASERHAAHEAVVAQATGVLRRALADPANQRVVLAGHSLGSVVAWDALRSLALEAEAGGPLPWRSLVRLDRVVTFGSPVDKIRFFHFADDLQDPTFAAVLEALRVDTRFGRFGDRPGGLAWDNYYDPAALIAGRRESPNDRALEAPVRNVALANGVFPNPVTTHVGYIENPVLLDGLIEAIRGGARPEASAPLALRTRAWWTAVELLIPAALLLVFLGGQLLPLVARAAAGDPVGWAALFILIATLFWLA